MIVRPQASIHQPSTRQMRRIPAIARTLPRSLHQAVTCLFCPEVWRAPWISPPCRHFGAPCREPAPTAPERRKCREKAVPRHCRQQPGHGQASAAVAPAAPGLEMAAAVPRERRSPPADAVPASARLPPAPIQSQIPFPAPPQVPAGAPAPANGRSPARKTPRSPAAASRKDPRSPGTTVSRWRSRHRSGSRPPPAGGNARRAAPTP